MIWGVCYLLRFKDLMGLSENLFDGFFFVLFDLHVA